MPPSQDAAVKAGAKRKRTAEPKFYAVRAGHSPGIYHTWPECLSEVKGFKGAIFKSFPTLTDAERFLKGEDPARSRGAASPPYKFYAVKSGRVPGIYTDWPSAREQVTGWTKPKHKCFSTRTEAQRFLDEGSAKSQETENGVQEADGEVNNVSQQDGDEPSPKKAKRSVKSSHSAQQEPLFEPAPLDYEPGTALPPGAQDGFDSNVLLKANSGEVVFKTRGQREVTKLKSVGLAPDQVLRIFTDGSSLRNGQKGAFAGVGVYFGPSDSRNLSESLPGPRQTNQRAELTAIVRALDTAPKDRDIMIITDSEYSINCATKWYVGWRNNGWKTANGKSVENRDIVESIVSRIEERSALRSKTAFEWIKGHANHAGNVEADKLAVNGARKAAHLATV